MKLEYLHKHILRHLKTVVIKIMWYTYKKYTNRTERKSLEIDL